MNVILQLVLLSIASGVIGAGVFCGRLLPEYRQGSDVVVEPELMQDREVWGEGAHADVLPELQEVLDGRWEKRAEALAARTGTLAPDGGAHRC